MHQFFIITVILEVLLASAGASKAQTGSVEISIHDLHAKADGMPGEQAWTKTIAVGPDIDVPCQLLVTSKGNGTLHCANLDLKVYDSHDDGMVYNGWLLHVEWKDINQDGYKDLVISGITSYTDEKSQKITKQEDVVFIYLFDIKTKTFVRTYKKASFNLSH